MQLQLWEEKVEETFTGVGSKCRICGTINVELETISRPYEPAWRFIKECAGCGYAYCD